MALDSLIVYNSPFPKIRVGSHNDGGYIIVDELHYDLLLSCGIANDITFEKNFLQKYPNTKCVAFDGTIDALPEPHTSIEFVKKNIATYNSDITTNLHDIIDMNTNIFLKMDIETFEFRWLHTLSKEQLKKLSQIVIEFHFPFTEPGFTHLDKPLEVPLKMKVFDILADTHYLIHLHANNCCGTTRYNNIVVPNVFECTYISKELVKDKPSYNQQPIPHPLDKPNTNNPEIHLSGYPFSH